MPAEEIKAAAAKASQRISKVSRPVTSTLDDAPAGKLILQHGEPPDAFLTGSSRSLQRRLLGLRIPPALPTRVVPPKKASKAKSRGTPPLPPL